MKVVIRGSSLPLTVLGILLHAEITRVKTTLRQGVAGPCRVGMSAADLAGRFGSGAVPSAKDGSVDLYFGEGRENPPELIAQMAGGAVFQIKVQSRRFRTSMGVGVGCAAGDLARFYQVLWQGPDIAYVPALGMGFEVQNGKVESILVS